MNLRQAVWCGVLAGALVGCDAGPTGDAAKPDPSVIVHSVEPSSPTPEGLAYVGAVAAVHERADAVGAVEAISLLEDGLALPVPGGLGEAEILRLELATRIAEGRLLEPSGARRAQELLAPMLASSRSLPLDRSTATALIVLGDAAVENGDHALAAGSYARAVRVMSMLRQELEQ